MIQKKTQPEEVTRVPMPKRVKNEMFAIVERVVGGSRMNVICGDGQTRLARIPGGRKRRMGRIRQNDLLIICPWDIQDEKADVIYHYRMNQARFLSRTKKIPVQLDIFS
ncbi:MAG: translation initiation factor eIF-1A [Candidatus Thermoplasmatota archaeon]|nr:translation initiation factor eIF-1A [Candidatus Thermoplasmatota archaeon]